MRTAFVTEVFSDLLGKGRLNLTDELLVVAGGRAERDLFESLGFEQATITNVDSVEASEQLAPYRWAHEDAQSLSYSDRSFPWVVMVDGLHHLSLIHI